MTDHPDPHAAIAQRFARETAQHELTVLHDDGLYRHLRFANPQYGDLYRFDLITWPNGMTIRGDGPTFVFSLYPTADLFDMFRGSSRYGINPFYWKEKVQAGRVRSWSEARFRKWLTATAEAGEEQHPGLVAAVTEQILDSDEHSLEYEEGARTAVAWFDHDGYELQFPAKWEQDFDDWSWEWLWACHAIVWGIAQYDQATVQQPAPVLAAAASTAPAEWVLTAENVEHVWQQIPGSKPHQSYPPGGKRLQVDGLTIWPHAGQPRQVARFGDTIRRDGARYTVTSPTGEPR